MYANIHMFDEYVAKATKRDVKVQAAALAGNGELTLIVNATYVVEGL